ncbi:hypothetical protein HDU98_003930 [Podochytrium sp. JEL0797]|nr:hypothetical protein HDU98_003930 [Podochytrium sp. JEL0797]
MDCLPFPPSFKQRLQRIILRRKATNMGLGPVIVSTSHTPNAEPIIDPTECPTTLSEVDNADSRMVNSINDLTAHPYEELHTTEDPGSPRESIAEQIQVLDPVLESDPDDADKKEYDSMFDVYQFAGPLDSMDPKSKSKQRGGAPDSRFTDLILPSNCVAHVYLSRSSVQLRTSQSLRTFLEQRGFLVQDSHTESGSHPSKAAIFVCLLSREYESSDRNQIELKESILRRCPIFVIKADNGPHRSSMLLLEETAYTTIAINKPTRDADLLAFAHAVRAQLYSLASIDALPQYAVDSAVQVPSVFTPPTAPPRNEILLSIHSFLDPVDLAAARDEISRKRHPLTRNWVIDQVCEWVVDSHSRQQVFWLSGDAGSGKSVIAAAVTLDHRVNAAGFFFCKFDERKRSDPAWMIRTLAYQLAQVDPEICGYLGQLAEMKPNLNMPIEELLQILLINPLKYRLNPAPVLICFDALDECAPENSAPRTAFLRALEATLPNLPLSVKLFITSRPGDEFYNLLKDSESCILELSSEVNKADIEIYATDALQALQPKLADPAKLHTLVNTLCDLSGGLFVWMFFTIEFLVASANVEASLATLQVSGMDLDNIYKASLRRFYPELNQDDLIAFHSVVGILAALKQPVGVTTLAALADQDFSTTRSVLSRISPFLRIFDSSVTFMHKSIADFLVSQPRCSGDATPFRIDPVQSNLLILNKCLDLTTHEWDHTGISVYRKVDFLLGMKPATSNSATPVEYASMHWMDHLESLGTTTRPMPSNFQDFMQLHSEAALLATVASGRGPVTSLLLTNAPDSPDNLLTRAEATGYYKSTLLYESVKLGNLSVCESLVTHTHTNLNIMGWTPVSTFAMNLGERGFSLLQTAIYGGNLEIVKLLAEKGANVEEKVFWGVNTLRFLASGKVKEYLVKVSVGGLVRASGMNPLQEVIVDGIVDRAISLLIDPSLVSAPNSRDDDKTALHYAAEYGHTCILDLMLKLFPSPSSTDSKGRTPLHFAVLREHVSTVTCLLHHGSNPNAQDDTLESPLHHACRSRNIQIISHLLTANANPNLLNAFFYPKSTPLHLATEMGNLEATKLLLAHGADPMIQTSHDTTAMFTAVYGGNVEVLKHLAECGYSLLGKHRGSSRLLHTACNFHQIDILKWLLEQNVPMEDPNDNISPLYLAAQNGAVECALHLIKNGINLEATGTSRGKYTPLHAASERGRGPMVYLLCKSGANVHACTTKGEVPIHLAATASTCEGAKILLEFGADVNSVEREGRTPLHLSAETEHVELCQLFLDSGANVDAEMVDGWRPLHFALHAGNEALVHLFLLSGCSLENLSRGWGNIACSGCKKKVGEGALFMCPTCKVQQSPAVQHYYLCGACNLKASELHRSHELMEQIDPVAKLNKYIHF